MQVPTTDCIYMDGRHERPHKWSRNISRSMPSVGLKPARDESGGRVAVLYSQWEEAEKRRPSLVPLTVPTSVITTPTMAKWETKESESISEALALHSKYHHMCNMNDILIFHFWNATFWHCFDESWGGNHAMPTKSWWCTYCMLSFWLLVNNS